MADGSLPVQPGAHASAAGPIAQIARAALAEAPDCPAGPIAHPGPGPAHAPSQAFAAIDLGTNNCRLLIARPSGANLIVTDAFSRIVRLGEGLGETGRLGDVAMDRAVAALRICGEKLRRRNVRLARSVATEACRRASNGAAFIARVHSETGIRLDVISAREEARLAVLGCQILLQPGMGPALIFDIGGGSTELVLVDTNPPVPTILDWVSMPWGVISLTERFAGEAASLEARQQRYAGMLETAITSMSEFAARIAPARAASQGSGTAQLLGTSGTVTTLASVHLGLTQFNRDAVDGLIVPAAAMRAVNARLSTMAMADRQQLPCIGRDRAELVVAGCAILDAIFDLWPAARLAIADRGIREGILRSLIATTARR